MVLGRELKSCCLLRSHRKRKEGGQEKDGAGEGWTSKQALLEVVAGTQPHCCYKEMQVQNDKSFCFFYEMVKHRRVEDLTQWMEPLFLRPVDPIRNPCIHGKARHSGLCVCL